MSGCVVLVVAAGRGRRFGGDLPKQYQDLGGRPVLRHCLATFAAHPLVTGVKVAIHPDDRALFDLAAAGLPGIAAVHGGETRQDSVRLGLEGMAQENPGMVLIHDGARPFVDFATISRVIAALAEHPGAIPAVAVADTLKKGADGLVAATVDRSALWRAQTPQGFRYADIREAHRSAQGRELTDDAAVAEQAGLAVALVPGSDDNVKITTACDLSRAARRFAGPGETRTGFGYDAHRFGPGDAVMLCGVKIAHDQGFIGHSDADVALHALTDAVLGAIGAGDIGLHFPPSDDQWKGMRSDVFLRHAAALVNGLGGAIVNVDVTIVCERPKVGPHRAAMVTRLADILGIAEGRVSVKATTTEGMGFTGRKEGVAAQAVATVRLPV